MADDTAPAPKRKRPGRKWFDATCEMCGATFRASRQDAKTCSGRCQHKRRTTKVKANPALQAELQEQRRQSYLRNRERALRNARRQRLRNPYAAHNRKHGVSEWPLLFQSLWDAQNGKCYLCGDPLDRKKYHAVTVDHDHACCPKGRSCAACRRGLACMLCNRLIGMAQDDPARLHRIADNLKRAKSGVRQRMAEAGGLLFWAA